MTMLSYVLFFFPDYLGVTGMFLLLRGLKRPLPVSSGTDLKKYPGLPGTIRPTLSMAAGHFGKIPDNALFLGHSGYRKQK